MFDTLKSLWSGFSGELARHAEARKLVWLLLFTFLAGWLATAFAAWVSYPSYRGSIEFLPLADWIAAFFTGGVAGFLYFGLAYLSGYFVERWRGTETAFRNYSLLGARVLGAACSLFLVVDVYMNIQGTSHRAEQAAGGLVTYSYQTPADRQTQMQADRSMLDRLLTGKLGGYGWRNPKDGIYHLNNSGKRYQRELSGNIRRLTLADSTDRASSLADQEMLNTLRGERESRTKAALKNAVYGVYLLVLILCIVQAYIVETIQEAQGLSWSRSATPSGKPATATRKTTSHSRSYPLGTDRRKSGKPLERKCEHCGTEFQGRSDKRFCSDTCRQEAWEARTGGKIKKGKRKAVSR